MSLRRKIVTITVTGCLLLVGLVLAVLSPRLLQTAKDEAMQHLLDETSCHGRANC